MAPPVMGTFQNRDGSDFLQLVDSRGAMVHKIMHDGTIYAPMIVFPDGSTQTTSANTNSSPGVPAPPAGGDVDSGTF
jgi:hypothetical protein